MLIVTMDGAVLNLDHVAQIWIEATTNHTWLIKADMDRWVSGRVLGEYNSRQDAEDELDEFLRCHDMNYETHYFERPDEQ